jgi:hypothetical protein
MGVLLQKKIKMRKLSIVLILLICGAAVSCKKSKNSIPDVIQPRGIHAKINGAAWTAQYANASSVTGGGHYMVAFDGEDSASHELISVTLSDFTGKGTQTITASGNNTAYYLQDTTGGFGMGNIINATSGTVTITMLNDTAVGGTFSFIAGSKTVTEGTFNVNY